MTAPDSEKHHGFEKVFQIVGGNGIFQWRLMFILSLQLIFLTWNHLGYIFIGAVPQHFCQVDTPFEANWSLEEIKELSIPQVPNSDPSLSSHYDSCTYNDLDYNLLFQKFGNDFSSAKEFVRKNQKLIEKKACDKWHYNDTIYSSTIVTEFDLVCGRRYLAATIQSTYMIGGLAGTFIFGTLNDKILGRRKSALIGILICLVAGFAATTAKSYWLFVFIRLFIAVGTAGCMQACSLLILEHCDIKSRATIYSIIGSFFGVGYGIMPLYAYYIRDWAYLQLAFSGTTLILLSYIWICPESPRWLASMGKDQEALEALLKIGKVNGKEDINKEELLQAIRECHKHHDAKENIGILKQLAGIGRNIKALVDTKEGVKRSLTVWTLFGIVAFVYYGMAFSTNLTSNPYLLVAFAGIMEIPACIVPVPFLSWWGRRPTTAISYFFTGIFVVAITFTPAEYEFLRVIFTMTGKFFIAAAFQLIYLVIGEVYPTTIRSTGQSSGTIMGRFGSIAAPYVADLLTTVYPDLPCVIFGVLSIFGGGVALLLPEMKDSDMMDQVSELEMEAL